jgi:UDP-glucose 4-epimerase
VTSAVTGSTFTPSSRMPWGQASFDATMAQSVHDFAERVASTGASAWRVYWCAGAGVVGTSAAAFALETAAFRRFLERVADEPALRERRGLLLLASSAGGVHAGSRIQPITERADPAPLSDYGRAKLGQEELLTQLAGQLPLLSTISARYSNLYGPGQNLHKPQGLISQLARCAVFGSPAQIFVPLDTIRDYLYAEDAGLLSVDALSRLAELEPGAHLVKIIASEREASIAAVLGIFRALTRRNLRVILGVRSVAALQPRRLTFRSEVWRGRAARARTELVDGVARVYRHQLRLLQLGALPRPA